MSSNDTPSARAKAESLGQEIHAHVIEADKVGMEYVTLKLKLDVWRKIIDALQSTRPASKAWSEMSTAERAAYNAGVEAAQSETPAIPQGWKLHYHKPWRTIIMIPAKLELAAPDKEGG